MDVFIVLWGRGEEKYRKLLKKVSDSIQLWEGTQWKIDLIHVFLDSFLF